MTKVRRAGWLELWPLALLCFVQASRWLLEGASPAFASTDWTQSIGCVLAAGLLTDLGRRRPMPTRPRGTDLQMAGDVSEPVEGSPLRQAAFRAGGTLLLLTGTRLGEVIAGKHLSASNVTLALALVPVVAAVASTALPEEAGGDLAGRLWPGLAGLTGLLLLLPEPGFSAVRPWIGLSLMPLLLAAGAELLLRGSARHEGTGNRNLFAVALGCLVAAAFFAGLAIAGHGSEQGVQAWSLRGATLDAACVVLLLFAVRAAGPRRWSAQFLLVPLISFAEGFGILHLLVDARSWIGLALVLAGTLRQVTPDQEARGDGVSLHVPSA